MKTKTHITLSVLTLGLWLPMWMMYQKGRNDGLAFLRESIEGFAASGKEPANPVPSMARDFNTASKYDADPARALNTKLRELQTKLSRAEFEKALFYLRLADIVRALAPFPAQSASPELSKAYTAALRTVRTPDQQEPALRDLLEALTHMTDAEGFIVAYPGPELDALQAAYERVQS